MAGRNGLRSLRNLIAEARDILRTTTLPESRIERAHELLTAGVDLAAHLLKESPAMAIGKKGGKISAKRGPDYFRKIAAMRISKRGGRPRNNEKTN